eukprot:SAG11_NODE_32150_length_285_cov_0.326203_1_plen_31_part_01
MVRCAIGGGNRLGAPWLESACGRWRLMCYAA